ncbi:DUF4934 domain-containing protein [Draconibacterium mangrovi]|uniref:DUF4934 domain-containing protein n=1 Tax=Draconibacterium mangrovi TaxID=2697469 RepID=UPI0013CF9439|nr:DUF4934 domain-containing protein [Draconibacterium mangrovi]
MIKIAYFILIILFILTGCKETKVPNTIKKIDLVSGYENKRIINLSEIAETVEYVQLSNKDSLIGLAPKFFVDAEYIVAIAFKQQFIFDRKSGEFIREVGRRDKGPNGYRFTKVNLPYNEKKQTLYAGGWRKNIIEYSIDGNVTRTFEKPDYVRILSSFVELNDSVFICYAPNVTGDDKAMLIYFDTYNNKIDNININDYFEKNPKRYRSWGEQEGWFYRFNNHLNIKTLFNDTIFRIENKTLLPKFEFFSGDFKPSSYRRNFVSKEEMKNFHLIEKIFESNRFIFFTLNYKSEYRSCIFDKRNEEVMISDSKKFDKTFFSIPYFGLNNDIDNFIQFFPQYINENNEIISYVDTYEVINWVNENPEKATKLPPYLQNLRNIKETDNPIIMIAKLKE